MEIDKLHIGDNLPILKSIPDESIDLIATDPPYYTKRDFGDYIDRFASLEDFISFIRERVIEFHRILKPTGSLYLQCDWRTVHYTKVMMDEIFGYNNFRNNIVWCYTGLTPPVDYFPRKHDDILFYSKSEQYTFNRQYIPYNGKIPKIDMIFGKRVKISDEHVKQLQERGKQMEDYWTDINSLKSGKEVVDYQTQKPVELYERIIKASSNEGDIVLDPFLGSGTTIVAAYRLKRKYIGIDMNPKSIEITRKRLDNEPKHLFRRRAS